MSWEVPVEIAPSPTHGTGVFAKEEIAPGTLVWKFDHSMHVCDHEDMQTYDRPTLEKALLGGFYHMPSGKFVWYRDGMDFVNHADGPYANIAAKSWTPLDQDANYATRTIQRGEELFEDYGFWSIFNLPPNHWIRMMYLQHCPQHYHFMQSLEPMREAA